MTLYAHPEFEAEFGELVGTVIADAVSDDPPGGETSRGTKGGHEAASPTPPCLLPASPSKLGPAPYSFTWLLSAQFASTTPSTRMLSNPFSPLAPPSRSFCFERGGESVARIQPRQELTGLTCFEFLVFKRALQRTEDGLCEGGEASEVLSCQVSSIAPRAKRRSGRSNRGSDCRRSATRQVWSAGGRTKGVALSDRLFVPA